MQAWFQALAFTSVVTLTASWYGQPTILRHFAPGARGGESFLRPGLNWAELDRQARMQSDTEAARDMQQAKRDALARISKLSA